MAIKLKFKDAIESDKIPAEIKSRLKSMEKGVFKTGSISSITPTKAASFGLTQPTFEEVKSYADARGVEFSEKDMPRVKLIVASTEVTDLDGDIVRQDFELESFKSNPAMPFCHNWDQLPVGVHLNEEVKQIKVEGYEGPALVITSLYGGPEAGQLAGEVFHAVDKGMLKGNSIGFEPLIITFYETDEERKQVGLGPWGIEINKSKLLECSPCLIPSNPLALVEAKASGELNVPELALVLESLNSLFEKSGSKEDEGRLKTYKSLATVLFPNTDFTKTPKEIIKENLSNSKPEVKELKGLDLDAFIVQYEKVLTRLAALEEEFKSFKAKAAASNKTVSLTELLGMAPAK